MHDNVHNPFQLIFFRTHPIFNMNKVHINMLYKPSFTIFMHAKISYDLFFKSKQIVHVSRPYASIYQQVSSHPIFNMNKVHINMLYKPSFTIFMHAKISYDLFFKSKQIVHVSRPYASIYQQVSSYKLFLFI
jgi:hypothetical protein